MWVRKTPEEIAEERNTPLRRLGSVALVGLFGFVLGLEVLRTVTFSDRAQILFAGALGLLAMIAAHLLQLRFGRPLFSRQFGQPMGKYLQLPSPDWQICDDCHRVTPYDGRQTCECGGKFNDLREWKLIDEAPNPMA